ncbi:MAG: glycosyltransferase family 2 protein [Nitrosarchaeum sp.]|nr:glycosyltransferase family 2 protein [Nitrosarchaeum sp.]
MTELHLRERYERIRHLLVFSKQYIQEFGFSFFIKSVLDELRQERFRILSPIFVSKLEVAANQFSQVSYADWLVQKLAIQKREKTLNISKNIHLYIVLDEKYDEKLLYNTVNSIKLQDHIDWKLFLVSTTNVKLTPIDDDRISIIDTNDDVNLINKHISEHSCDYVGFLDVGDQLQFNSLSKLLSDASCDSSDIIYSDSDEIDSNGNRDNPFFKPDWLPYLILSTNYIGFFLIKYTIFTSIGGLKQKIFQHGLYDLLLRASEKTKQIHHVKFPLISYMKNKSNLCSYNIDIIQNTLSRRKIQAKVLPGKFEHTVRIQYPLVKIPKVSIIIPTKDSKTILERCINSIENKTDYTNWEILIVDNSSKKEETKNYLNSLPYKVITYNDNYNFSKINNLASKHATGELLLFMNDDVAALESSWLDELVSLCMQPDVAIVGPKLVYQNDTIQSAGTFFLNTGAGWHPYSKKDSDYSDNFGLANMIRDYSAITASCMIMKKDIFDSVGGYDEEFDLYYGDTDLCFKAKSLGYHVLYTPYAKLLHDGSVTTTREAKSFFTVENHYRFIKKHPWIKQGDPAYTPNLSWNHFLTLE